MALRGIDVSTVAPAGAALANEPAQYAPFLGGVYSVAPKLSSFAKDFGNGAADTRVFQFDREFPHYRVNILDARRENIAKYYGIADCPSSVLNEICRFITETLATEYSDFFVRTARSLVCRLTDETLHFGSDFNLLPESDGNYRSVFDALASQVQEDLAVVHVADGIDRLVAVHITAPSYWDPREKLGKSFAEVHAPVPGIGPLNRKGRELMEAMTRGARYQRFVWSVVTDRRLNHHPEPPPDWIAREDEWLGRRFDPASPELFVRVERQVIVGFEAISAFLFTIRTYLYNVAELSHLHRRRLAQALESMSPASRQYKGVSRDIAAIVAWLWKD